MASLLTLKENFLFFVFTILIFGMRLPESTVMVLP